MKYIIKKVNYNNKYLIVVYFNYREGINITCNGIFTDSGGLIKKYANNESYI